MEYYILPSDEFLKPAISKEIKVVCLNFFVLF